MRQQDRDDMDIRTTETNQKTTVTLTGRLDSEGSNELEEWVAANLAPPRQNMVLDFSQLDYVSSAGLRSILKISKLVKKHSLRIAICAIQDHVREVFEISGFDTFIPLYNTADDCPL